MTACFETMRNIPGILSENRLFGTDYVLDVACSMAVAIVNSRSLQNKVDDFQQLLLKTIRIYTLLDASVRGGEVFDEILNGTHVVAAPVEVACIFQLIKLFNKTAIFSNSKRVLWYESRLEGAVCKRDAVHTKDVRLRSSAYVRTSSSMSF